VEKPTVRRNQDCSSAFGTNVDPIQANQSVDYHPRVRTEDQATGGAALIAVTNATQTIDGCIFHDWPSTRALAEYVDPGWREMFLREGDLGGPLTLKSEWLYADPRGFATSEAYPERGGPGSDLGLTVTQALGDHRYGVLGYHEGLLSAGLNNYLMARAATRAANRWTIDEWLAVESRLRALVLICTSVPEAAAGDVREFGAHPGIVGVAMGANGLGRPFGHACYHEIYEAAVELELPIVIQTGSDSIAALDGTPVSGGPAATYAEYLTHSTQPFMGHLSSFIIDGVFEKFPTLRVLCVGSGAAWIPACAWRFDYWYKLNSHELPWLKRLPSEYLRDHVRIGTSSLERPRNTQELDALWRSWPGFENVLLYTSGYPSRDAESASETASRIPSEWHEAVFFRNAVDLFSLEA
jgi:predicted TIM-barrel fold metal-dependent hydrolase